jgi:hypothetical protein
MTSVFLMAFGVETVGKVAFTCAFGFALESCLL